MAILHGNWLLKKQGGCLFIWGENWRSLSINSDSASLLEVNNHPLAMATDELVEWLHSSNLQIPKLLMLSEPVAVSAGRTRKAGNTTLAKLPSQNQIIALPTYLPDGEAKTISMNPVHSATLTWDTADDAKKAYFLYPWRVEGFCLEPIEAMKFLRALPLGSNTENTFIGGDLRFWSQVARWSLDLQSRGKFLPILRRANDDAVVASWRSLLDSAQDSSRLEKFAQAMPAACLMYEQGENAPHVDLPLPPQELLLGFLNSTIDAQIRAASNNSLPIPSPIREWLQALSSNAPTVEAEPAQLERLEAIIKAWIAPVQYQLSLIHI